MEKEIKPTHLVILCVAAIFMLTACGNRPTTKERVLAVFDGQEELILEKIANSRADDEVEWDDLEGVIRVHTYSNGIIEFECIAEGLMTAGVYAGFYYSPDDEPDSDSVSWLHGELVQDGNGYSYRNGDDCYYTERICENFYYYNATN